jgi:hypothetical protein
MLSTGDLPTMLLNTLATPIPPAVFELPAAAAVALPAGDNVQHWLPFLPC